MTDPKAWPADVVERIPIAELIPYARNARTHPRWQIEQIKKSMLEWGWTIPCLIDESRNLLAGHGRIIAAGELEWPDAPCMTARGWSDAQKRAYVLADNKLALNADWDLQVLDAELKSLDDEAIALAGFNDADLAALKTMTDALGTTDAHVEWSRGGMPAFEQTDLRPHRSILMHFRNDEDLAKFAAMIAQPITDKTKFAWYPERHNNVFADKRYASAADVPRVNAESNKAEA